MREMEKNLTDISKRIDYVRPVLIFLVLLIHSERAFRRYPIPYGGG